MDTHHTKIKANIRKSNEVTTLEWLFFAWSLLFKFHHSDGKYTKKPLTINLTIDIIWLVAQKYSSAELYISTIFRSFAMYCRTITIDNKR